MDGYLGIALLVVLAVIAASLVRIATRRPLSEDERRYQWYREKMKRARRAR